ncbi:MAG: N-acetylglucosaminyl transferase [Candidatus Westeberhardia cardiocondylae]|nr:N-acetylglucosaminyl transferase [Candidatus Westeberhardia cardiocondylae]
MKKKKTIIIAAGGSGGHVIPGLTIANVLKKHWNVQWIGTNNHIESILVPKNNIKIHFIQVIGFREQTIIQKIMSIMYILCACYYSAKIIKKIKPDVILGMGNYISIPVILTAWLYKVPTIIHEQNAIAGLTNKLLSKISNLTLQGFPNTIPYAYFVGNPIRKKLLSIPSPQQRLKKRIGPIRILVMGGSQGSKTINTILPKIAQELSNNFIFWHQVGNNPKILNLVKNNYIQLCGKKAKKYKIVTFIRNMYKAYFWADLVICQSGAMTVSEITQIGIPALFIPFTHKDQQQYFNAKTLEKIGAAKIIHKSKTTTNKIIEILKKINRKILLKMAKLAKTQSKPNSTKKIIKYIKLIKKNNFHT